MLRVAWKSVLGSKLRFLLTAFAVVVGVAFVSGVFVLTDSINAAFSGLFGEINAGVSAYVNPVSDVEAEIAGGTGALGGPTLDEALLDEVRGVDGVEDAEGFVQGFAVVLDADGEKVGADGPPNFGFSWVDGTGGLLRIVEGRPPASADEVVLDGGTIDLGGFALGESVTIVFVDQPPTSFELVGQSAFGETDNLLGATTASFVLDRAQQLFGQDGRLSQIAVQGAAGVDDAVLADRIEAVVGTAGVEVVTGAEQNDSDLAEIEQGLGFVSSALLAFAGIALFVGSFIVVNTFTITVAQRTREFALLRAVGASASQVRRAVVVEAAVVGVVASVLGLGLGVALAALLQTVLDASGVSLPSAGVVVEPRTYVAAFAIGIGVTVLASLLPARRASRIAPIEALRGGGVEDGGIGRARTIGGALAGAVGVAMLLVGLLTAPENALTLVGFGAALTFVGVALLAPYAAGPVAGLLGAPAARLGVPGALARRNAQRSPQRTASTASALMIGVALVAFVSIFAASITRSVNTLFDEQFAADLSISIDAGFGPPQPVPSRIKVDLQELPELGAVASIGFSNVRIAPSEGTSFVAATDPATAGEVFDLGVVEGSLDDLSSDGADPTRGGVFVDDEVAASDAIAVGDELVADFAAVAGVRLTVVGIFANEELVGAPYLVANDDLRAWAGSLGDQFIAADLAPGVTEAQARAAVEGVTDAYPGVQVQTTAELRQQAEEQVDGLLNFFIVLLLLAVVIAIIGIINTLALSVFERTREIGLLRAVGMVRRQARAMIRWEAVIVAVFGALLGIAIGTFFGFAMVRALADQGITELALPTGRLVAYVVVAGVAGVVAAIFPARRAARLDVLDAVTSE